MEILKLVDEKARLEEQTEALDGILRGETIDNHDCHASPEDGCECEMGYDPEPNKEAERLWSER